MNHFKLLLIIICAFQMSFGQNIVEVHKDFIFDNAPFKECHSSTIESTSGGLIAAWFGGTKEGNKDVQIWVSRNENGKWTTPIAVADGIQHNNKRYPTWNPVLFLTPDNTLMLFYKVGPSPSEWWGELKTSNDNGITWSDSKRLPEDILGPIKNKPILLDDGRLMCPVSTEVGPNEGWRIHFDVTRDFGKTWEYKNVIDPESKFNVIQQSLLKHKGDTLQILARSKDSGVISSWSYDYGRTWKNLELTGLPNPNSGIDAVTLRNGKQLLVYNKSGKQENQWSGKRTPLNVAISNDGVNWEDIYTLENEEGEFSYPAVIQSKDGNVHITYTWKRKKIRHVVLKLSN